MGMKNVNIFEINRRSVLKVKPFYTRKPYYIHMLNGDSNNLFVDIIVTIPNIIYDIPMIEHIYFVVNVFNVNINMKIFSRFPENKK